MEPDGRTTAWLREDDDNDWIDAGQVKVGEGWDRAYYRFADADGMSIPIELGVFIPLEYKRRGDANTKQATEGLI